MSTKTINLDKLPTSKKGLRGILADLGLSKKDWKGMDEAALTELVTTTVESERKLASMNDSAGIPADTDNAYNADEIRRIASKGKAAEVKTACEALNIDAKNGKDGKAKLNALVEGIDGDPRVSLENLATALRSSGGFLAALTIELALQSIAVTPEDLGVDVESDDESDDDGDEDSEFSMQDWLSEAMDDDENAVELANTDLGLTKSKKAGTCRKKLQALLDSDDTDWNELGAKLQAAGWEALEGLEFGGEDDEDEPDESDGPREFIIDFIRETMEDDDEVVELAADLGLTKSKKATTCRKKVEAWLDSDEDRDWNAIGQSLQDADWNAFEGMDFTTDDEDEGDDDDSEEEEEDASLTIEFFMDEDEDGDTFANIVGGKKLTKLHSALTAKALRAAAFDYDDEVTGCWYTDGGKKAWKATKKAIEALVEVDVTWEKVDAPDAE